MTIFRDFLRDHFPRTPRLRAFSWTSAGCPTQAPFAWLGISDTPSFACHPERSDGSLFPARIPSSWTQGRLARAILFNLPSAICHLRSWPKPLLSPAERTFA
jgi:hypothetical protein